MTDPVVLTLLDEHNEDPPPTRELTLPVPAGWPAPPAQAVYHGLAGEIAGTIAPHTEADRATRGRTLRVSYADWRIG